MDQSKMYFFHFWFLKSLLCRNTYVGHVHSRVTYLPIHGRDLSYQESLDYIINTLSTFTLKNIGPTT